MLPGWLDDAGSLAGKEPRIASSSSHSSCWFELLLVCSVNVLSSS
jgi:hypothetical protein